MMKRLSLFGLAATLVCSGVGAWGESVSGVLKDAFGAPLRGVMVSAIKGDFDMSVSVLSQKDGTFTIDDLAPNSYSIRARYIGLEDNTIKNITAGSAQSASVAFSMEPARDINLQRTADNLLSLVKFENVADKENFKMMCAYCHQIGTLGFRSPELPVDWSTMITRMSGFGGLYKHLQDTVVARLLDTYSDEAVEDWPEYAGPPAPEDAVLNMRITEWDVRHRTKTKGPRGNDPKLYGTGDRKERRLHARLGDWQ